MIEEMINLLMALTIVAITLLDPMMQIANGVDLYMEAARTSPLIVSCPPKVLNGSWICSERRPLPECYLFCPCGLVPVWMRAGWTARPTSRTTPPTLLAPVLGSSSSEDWTSTMFQSQKLKAFHQTGKSNITWKTKQ